MEGQKVEPCGEELEVVNRALEGGSWRERDPEIRLNSPSCQLSRKVSLPREKLHEMRPQQAQGSVEPSRSRNSREAGRGFHRADGGRASLGP